MQPVEESRLAAIRELAEPILAEREIELVELACRPQGRQVVVRLLVDGVGGVTIQQCAQVNQRLSAALEAANLFEGSYAVEVSSPGLDRPLVSPRDFERAIGEQVQLDILQADGRSAPASGMVLAIAHETLVLKTGSGNVSVPLGQVRNARKAIRW